ncbi:hypothetical protein I307_05431 [Cryptococcus deuterogattii 99/473]|uniref:Uncharacterized protein n=2 Tax=Cryptococcus deuterogattii TaxID=1859096 RepID=A0A0D0UZH1_9TREE|nr:hypothetical protein CNBG_0310 [Cryptococcus deuterogattii R265]KIR25760.1 hypothetical protein I309_05456 [Cryptococcus deuterogattii LA55]KIR33819.1 hypothetical protein I352_03901 [Cryptococcus deuterogattii MMRL2647]KIR40631.1 hypothetical protein I313_03282 [Cryptococcus deuterogattii Ram5]KIR74312.1 hypothetical protein I310_01914 [Cryptococcus deuterogattii CA1014]KIR94201.1 hypothetical protein I304_01838 [Cryptococcus deuterogattii CBS 10090]KIS01208.1 hypothetical protein L804_01
MFARALILLAAVAGALADLTVSTPASLIQCQPVLLSWSGGTAPYYLAIIPGGQASAAALKDFGEQSGTSLTWTVDTASGTSVSVKVTDSTGAINYSSPVTIQAGSSDSCVSTSTAATGSTESSTESSSASTVVAAAASSSADSSSASKATSSVASSGASKAASASASASTTASSGAKGFASVSLIGTAVFAVAAGAIALW